MVPISVFSAPYGGAGFLGLRQGKGGRVEIVYDDGVARRLVWRVTGIAPDSQRRSERLLAEALQSALRQSKVLPALYAELRKRAITIEAVAP